MMRYDLHVHTKYSTRDGVMSPEKIIKLSVKKHLNGIAITDHNTIKGGLEAKKITHKIDIIIGSEIMTERGEVTGLFLNEEIRPGKFVEIVEKIREQGGVVVSPHPFDKLRLGIKPTAEDKKYLDCVEVLNSRCVKTKYNDEAVEYCKEMSLGKTAGSDAHFPGEIGKAWIETDKDVRKSILRGDVIIKGGVSSPLYHVRTKFVKWGLPHSLNSK